MSQLRGLARYGGLRACLQDYTVYRLHCGRVLVRTLLWGRVPHFFKIHVATHAMRVTATRAG